MEASILAASVATIYDALRKEFAQLVERAGFGKGDTDHVVVTAPLTPEQAIGRPKEHDYPIVKGRETMIEARVGSAAGQAFTDAPGCFQGSLTEVLHMPLTTNFERAVFVSTLNALCRRTGIIRTSRHCRDQAPRVCADEIAAQVARRFGRPRILIVGFQPRLVERLAGGFPVAVTDLDATNVGQERFGVRVSDASETESLLEWCDLALVTGTTLVNGTTGPFIQRAKEGKPTIFYGVTIAGAAALLGLDHICPCGE